MTTPTIFSDVASNPQVSKYMPQGVLAQQAVVSVPAGTAIGTNLGMIRIQPGFTLLSLDIKSDDLDTATNVQLDFGYLYDGTSGEDQNAYISASTIAQTGVNEVWPTSTSLLVGDTPELTDDGYISITIINGATTTAGDITVQATFTYDN